MSDPMDQIKAVIRRVDDIDMAATLIWTICEAAILAAQRSRDRDRKQKQRCPGQSRDTPGQSRDIALSGSDLDLFSPGDRIPSKQIPGDREIMSARPVALAVVKPLTQFDRLIEVFCQTWERHYGAPYFPMPADRNQFGRLLRDIGKERAETLPVCFERYLQDQEQFVAQSHRHSLKWFCASDGVNKYRVTAVVVSAKEARSLEAGRQFMGEGNGTKR